MTLPAARQLDIHICPMVDGVVPHVGGPINIGAPTVLIGGLPAARMTALCTCASAPDVIVRSSVTVLVAGLPATRMFDTTAHGGFIASGFPMVLIGG